MDGVNESGGDRIIGELLADLDLAYREAEIATRNWAAAMQAGRYESAAAMIPEIQRAHGLVIERIRECREVLQVQVEEWHRRLKDQRPVRVAAGDGPPSLCPDTGKFLAAVIMVVGFLLLLRLMTNGGL